MSKRWAVKFYFSTGFFHLIRPNFVSFYEVNFSCPALGCVSLFLSFFFANPNILPLFQFSGWCHLCTGHLKSLLLRPNELGSTEINAVVPSNLAERRFVSKCPMELGSTGEKLKNQIPGKCITHIINDRFC